MRSILAAVDIHLVYLVAGLAIMSVAIAAALAPRGWGMLPWFALGGFALLQFPLFTRVGDLRKRAQEWLGYVLINEAVVTGLLGSVWLLGRILRAS